MRLKAFYLLKHAKSPTGKSLLIVSSEGDGTVKVYTTESLVP